MSVYRLPGAPAERSALEEIELLEQRHRRSLCRVGALTFACSAISAFVIAVGILQARWMMALQATIGVALIVLIHRRAREAAECEFRDVRARLLAKGEWR